MGGGHRTVVPVFEMVYCELNTRYVPLSVSRPDSHYVCANEANAFLE